MAKKVIMPKFGMDQEEGTVAQWLRQEGETVEKGEPLLEVETDKVNMEVEAPASGVLRGIRIGPGVTVPIGEVIAYILRPGEEMPEAGIGDPGSGIGDRENTLDAPRTTHQADQDRTPVKITPVAEQMAEHHGVDPSAIPASGPRITKQDVEAYLAQQPAQESAAPGANGEAIRAVPAARRLARELGVDLATVQGSGPDGRVQSKDVQQAAHSPAPAPQSPIPSPQSPTVRRTVPLTGMRRTIANRLTASVQQIPQFTVSMHANMGRANGLIDDIRSEWREGQPKVTITSLLIKACAWTLARYPQVNASFQENAIVEWGEINMGVAVALEEGLIVPVIRSADRLNLTEIAASLNALADRARAGKLTPDDLQGGTFTISNLGMFGVENFTAIINPPQAAILAVGRTLPQPVVNERGEVEVQPLANLTLTADHRVIDGALAGRFLSELKRALERPGLLMG
jgi:pyruvate dehydrogenase E2 component (dihydrolipoamide acetyltransferase)